MTTCVLPLTLDAPDEGARPSDRPVLSLVTPAYNESANLPVLHAQLAAVLDPLGVSWEWIVVDDRSQDATFAVVRQLSAGDARVRGVRLARNMGSHGAIRAGLRLARGQAAVVLAADLQDPPAVIPDLLAKWRAGAKVVWAARHRREGESRLNVLCSRLYWGMMRHLVGMKDTPARGADFFLMDAQAVAALNQFHEDNTSIVGLITWMGFEQTAIQYDKQARLHGCSGWTLGKKLKAALDSVIAFSYLPMRLMSLAGVLAAAGGLLLAAWLIYARIVGLVIAGTGYVAIMTVLLLGFGFVMVFLGVLGEYVWRTLDEVRRRPRDLFEDAIGTGAGQPAR